ncbi:arylsulfatase [Prauserella cavernicola]|uniref:Arylsulfatase n=1 Tax=Prauserella cavernicola TaxID=2800127 RepID=A0A934QYZ7_9PSEU|nr:arylsulfatase [Prauserella cavernicola]MBK1789136.1 arylsulfatase [Prauserella cavernicola]
MTHANGCGSSAGARRPNVVLVLLDDMGFGASSAFGGPCRMPCAETLASNGLAYNQFHSTALCSPTRQALLTGRNHHAVNMGTITDRAVSVPGYSSVRPDGATPLAQLMRRGGYRTAAFGKWHQTPDWETNPLTGPFDRWPTGEGFDEFYGFCAADTDQFQPTLIHGTRPVDPPARPDYHLSEDLVDRAVEWMSPERDDPAFVYLSFGATHAPHQVPDSWLHRYRGEFDDGWDVARERTFERQKAAGVIPASAQLTPRPADIPAWSSLSPDERRLSARFMEVYAAFAEHTDAQVGRLVEHLRTTGQLENTLIFYILGDNGAAFAGGVDGAVNENAALNGERPTPAEMLPRIDTLGTRYAYNDYPVGWAHAMNTPFQWTKMVASHLGGTRQGLVVHWPRGIEAAGQLRTQWHHVVDVAPTLAEILDLPAGDQEFDGFSMARTLERDGDDDHPPQYFEMHGNRAVWSDGWWACAKHATPWKARLGSGGNFDADVWELYAPGDWSQCDDVAGQHPEKLAELRELFDDQAKRNNVYPLDDRHLERFLPELAGRPDDLLSAGSVQLPATAWGLGEGAAPNVKNRSFRLTVEIEGGGTPESTGDGVLVAQGGRFGGWVLYVEDGFVTYCHNYLGLDRTFVRSASRLSGARQLVELDVGYSGEGYGGPADVAIRIDGSTSAEGHLARTVPFLYSLSDGMDVGGDHGTPVVDTYRRPYGEFSGTILSVRFDLGDGHAPPPAAVEAVEAVE